MDSIELTKLSGTRDFLPEDHKYFTFLKKVFRHEFRRNGYRRISHPSFEKLDLMRKIFPENNNDYGLYRFTDKQWQELALVPNGVLGTMRSYIENEVFEELQPVYYYYISKFFRQDRKRKEFYSIGAEVVGETDPIIDAQLIYMVYQSLCKIGFQDELVLKINSYGNEKEMTKFYEELESFFENKKHILSSATRENMDKDILSIFSTQYEDEKILIESSIPITKFLKKDSKAHYENVKEYLTLLGISFEEDHTLFFKESYYSSVVWSLQTKSGKTLCTGGRYDTLSKQLGYDKVYAAAGFTLDVFRVIDILREKEIKIKNKDKIDLYFVQLGDEAKKVVFPLSLQAREKGINTLASLGTPSMKEQMLKAQRIGARFVVLVGVMEARNGMFQVRDTIAGTQEEVRREELIEYIISKIGKEQLDFYDPARDLIGL